MSNAITVEQVEGLISTLAAAEKITKATLSELSRVLLTYVLVEGTHDIDKVNRTLKVLTPMNKKTAALFFQRFLPWNFEDKSGQFTVMMHKRHRAVYAERVDQFLSDESNDIWTWAADNVKVEQKAVDWSKKISNDVSKALDADVDPMDIIEFVLKGGVTAQDLFAAADAKHVGPVMPIIEHVPEPEAAVH